MSKANPKVDGYLSRVKNWREESQKLRTILLKCDLTEDLKWGKPCYAFQNSNIAIIQGFKQYFALLFLKGVLLKDPEGILQKTGQNARVGRQIRFTDAKEIARMEASVKAYVQQAIAIEKAGLKVDLPETAELKYPEELKRKLDEMPALKKAFAALTPGRQRGYSFFFSAPKQSKTRESRIEKCIPQILKGKGLND